MRRLSLIATATFCIVIIVSFCLCSCTKWHWTDPIGLSQKVITVDAAGGEVIVDATGTFSLSELYIFDSEENTHPASDNWGRIPKDPEDPYSEMDNAAYKQAVDSARKMKVKGYAIQDIAEITGLTAEEIETL